MLIRSIAAALHGHTPSAGAITIAYLTGIVGASLAMLFRWTVVPQTTPLAYVVLGIVSLDIFAGLIANLSSSTRSFYRARPAALRFLFLAVHVSQPALIAVFVEPTAWLFMLACYLTALIGGSVVLAIRSDSLREAAAGSVFGLGAAACLTLSGSESGLAWFAPVYLGKLVLGFALGTAEGRDTENR